MVVPSELHKMSSSQSYTHVSGKCSLASRDRPGAFAITSARKTTIWLELESFAITSAYMFDSLCSWDCWHGPGPQGSGLVIGPPSQQLFAGAIFTERTLIHPAFQQERVRASDITALRNAQDLHDLSSVQVWPDRV